jgi:uncharacterized protein (TIGR04255 family)
MLKAIFQKAPLTEVICGVEFNAPDFSSVHFGMYWQEIRERFPTFPTDRPPIGEIPVLPFLPKLRRVWFQSADKQKLIQLQADKFLYNWRKLDENDQYPHFQEVYQAFEGEWQKFQTWWSDIQKSNPPSFSEPEFQSFLRFLQPIRYELTYINQIDVSLGWSNPGEHQKVFNFIGRSWESCTLGQPALQNTNLEFVLPNGLGTLSVVVSQAMKLDETPLLFCELTARSPDARVELSRWFEAAHQNVVQTFIDLLQEDIKKIWGLQWLEQ